MTVDELVVQLGLKTNNFEQGLKKAQTLATGFVAGIGMAFGNMFGGMIQEVLNFIPRAFNKMKEEVKALDELNKRTNASVEDIAAWGNVVELSGGSAKAFQGTLQHLYNDLSRIAITGKGRSKPFLEALGIDVASLKDKEIFDVIEEIQKAVQGMDNKKASYALKNLGFDPDTIKLLLENNTKELQNLIKEQKEWGVYTKKDVEALDKLDKAIKMVKNVLHTALLPIFTKVLQTFSKGARYIADGMTYLRKNSDVLRGALILLAATLIGPLKKALTTLFIDSKIGMLVTGLSMVLLLLEDLWVYAKGGKSYFKDFWRQFFGDPQAAMERFNAAGRTLERFFKFISKLLGGKGTSKEAKFLMMIATAVIFLIATIGALPVALATAFAVILSYWEDIEKFFSELPGAVEDAFDTILDVIVLIFNGIKKLVGEAIDSIINTIKGLFESVKAFFEEVWNGIVTAFENAKNSLIGIWEELKSMFLSGASAVGDALANAANVAKNAWKGFINWLKDKWQWLSDKLPDFLKAADKLPKAEAAVKMSAKGSNGGGDTNYNYDYSNKSWNATLTNGVAVDKFIKKSGFVPQVNTGVAGR